jgi:hypothetical protein
VPHVPYQLTGRQFAHGAIDVMLIAGPRFDVAVRENMPR